MGIGYKTRRGGSNTKAYAAIQVQYASGAEVSVTDGKKTFRPPDNTVGLWVCAVPYAADWTVAAGDKTEVVRITKEGQIETVNLAVLYFYSPGDEHSDITGGWSSAQNATVSKQTTQMKITPTQQYDGNQAMVATVNAIDMTNLTTLYFRALNNCNEDEYLGVGVKKSRAGTSWAKVAWFAAHEEKTAAVNVSTLSGLYYPSIEVYWGGTVKGSGIIYEVWGE